MTVRKPAPPVTRIAESATGRPSGARRVPSMVPVVSCAQRAPGTKTTVASSGASRRTAGRLRLLPQHGETADRVPKRTAHEDVRQKVGRQGKPRKSDHCRHAVRRVWNPAVISIPAGDDSGDREGRDGVTRRETSVSPQK